MENTHRVKPIQQNHEINVKSKLSKSTKGGRSVFSALEKRLQFETFFKEGFPIHYIPNILFVVFLSLIYISNTHYTEKTIRQIDRLHLEVEDLRADYTTLKSDLMFASKQSEVARRVKILGLKESLTPPFKVVVK